MRFEWDPVKAAKNASKHGVTFETAVQVFADPLAQSVQDPYAIGEVRWQTLGVVNNVILLLVVHTWYDDEQAEVMRIISARRATKKERQTYERGR